MEQLPSGLTVCAVQHVMSVTKDKPGTAALRAEWKPGVGSSVYGPDVYPSADDYFMTFDGREDLVTSDEVNALRVGMDRTA